MGITSILVEGGGQINAALLEYRLIDKVQAFIAPKIIGGKNAPSPVAGQGASEVNAAIGLEELSVRIISEDILITGYVKKEVK